MGCREAAAYRHWSLIAPLLLFCHSAQVATQAHAPPQPASEEGGQDLDLLVFSPLPGQPGASLLAAAPAAAGDAPRPDAAGPAGKNATAATCSEGMVLTPYFTTHKDWQRGRRVPAYAGKIRALLESTARLGLCVSIVYDSLPYWLIKQLSGERVHFERVDLQEFNPRLATTDSRFLAYEKLLLAHPEWRRAFMVDAFDVTAAADPFPHMKDGALYIGSDAGPIRDSAFMRARFMEMGGKYFRWFLEVPSGAPILNAGVVGGGREELLRLLGKMREVFTDKSLAAWTSRGEVHVDMGALNYAVYTNFARNFTVGAPVSSRFRGYERKRKDVWFVHKL